MKKILLLLLLSIISININAQVSCYAVADIGSDTITACDSVLLSTNAIANVTYSWTHPNTPLMPNIGDAYEGGFVFSLPGIGYNNTDSIYIVSPENQMIKQNCPGYSSGLYSSYVFWSYYNTSSGWNNQQLGTDTYFGSGKSNTNLMVNHFSSAAMMCDTLTLNSYTDWFLPSKDELQELVNSFSNGSLSLLNSCNSTLSAVWSSSEYSYNRAWVNGSWATSQGHDDKTAGYAVRAIRTTSLPVNSDTANTFSVSNSGWYYVTVTDSLGCTATDSVYVNIGINGCMDSTAFNYDSLATCDNGSCIAVAYGCTDPLALNYDSLANIDDSTCCGSSFPIPFGTQIGQDIDGEYQSDFSGSSISLSDDGNTVAIGARGNDGNGSNSGHVRIYNYNGTSWNQLGNDIDGEAAGDISSGWLGALQLSGDGNTVAIGAEYNDGNGSNSGHVRVFNWNGSSWNQFGQDIDGESQSDFSGYSVSLSSDGNRVAIGARGAGYNNGNGSNSGHVRIYENISGSWTQIGQDIDGAAVDMYSGHSVSLNSDGNTVAIGAPGFSNGSGAGHVQIYNYNAGSWNQLGQDIDGAAGDYSGYSVSISSNGNTVAIGSPEDSAGHVRIYNYNGASWNQLGVDIDGESQDDFSGCSVSLSDDGNTVAIGAYRNDGNSSNPDFNSGHVRVFSVAQYISPVCSGCTDSLAVNYDPYSLIDDNSCIYPGCTNTNAINYDSTANTDDGSCYYCNISNSVTIVSPSNFNSCNGWALTNTSSNYPIVSYNWYNTQGAIVSTSNFAMNLCNNLYVLSVTDSAGCVANDTLIIGILPVYGCIDSTAYNYNPLANTDDSSCLYCDLNNSFVVMQNTPGNCNGLILANASSSNGPITYLWSNSSTQNNIIDLCMGVYSVTITDAVGCIIQDTVLIGVTYGCMDSTALNYNSSANIDDGTCTYCVYGCTDPLAINYNLSATCNDGSCTYPQSCGAITGVYMSDVIHDRGTFNWDNMNSSTCQVDQIRFRYRPVGTNSWSTKTMGVPVGGGCNTSNTSKLVLNLIPNTTYEYDFKIWYCNASTVNWHANGTFTTLAVCDNVINVIPTPITTTKTQFCWDSVSTYAFVRLKYREDVPGSSFSNIGGMGVVSPILCKDKNGITPGLTYRVMWRTWCSPNGGPYRSAGWDGPVLWTQPTSIRVEGGTSINNLEIYPNPSRDVFNVEFTSYSKQSIEVRVVNLVGEIIFTENLENFEGEYIHSFNLSEYSKGVYLLELDTDNGIVNKKLILQ